MVLTSALFLRIKLLKQIVGRTFQNIAQGLQIFKFDPVRLVVDHLTKILIAQAKLNVEPILRFAFLRQYVQYP